MYPAQGSAKVVVLARNDVYADGLSGSPLAHALDGPLLVTPSSSLSGETQEAIGQVLAPGGTVVILGGTNAVDGSVAERLRSLGYRVDRIGGTDRFATATMVADRILAGWSVRRAYVATGTSFADALSAASAAGVTDGVVLLTNGRAMPSSTATWLEGHDRIATTAIGGAAAAAHPGAPSIVGQDRYATAAEVAAEVLPRTAGVVVTTGTDFPDGLGGAVFASYKSWSMLLVDPSATGLNPAQSDYLRRAGSTVKEVVAIGGTDAVPPQAVSLVQGGLLGE